MNISYKLFKEAIEFIDKREQQYIQLDEMIKEIEPDSWIFPDSGYSLMLQKLLVDATDDEYGYISYFMWDLDFGRKWKPGTITNPDGTDVPLGTIEDLWNLLKNNSNHKTTNEELGILGF